MYGVYNHGMHVFDTYSAVIIIDGQIGVIVPTRFIPFSILGAASRSDGAAVIHSGRLNRFAKTLGSVRKRRNRSNLRVDTLGARGWSYRLFVIFSVNYTFLHVVVCIDSYISAFISDHFCHSGKIMLKIYFIMPSETPEKVVSRSNLLQHDIDVKELPK